MRKYLRLAILAVLACTSAAGAQTVMELRSTDTLWIDSIATHSGQQATVGVYFSNTDTINALDVPLTYFYPDLIIDSVSFVGSRIENRFITIVNYSPDSAICHIGAFYFDTTLEEVGPGSGLLARIHVTIPDNYDTRLIPIDTTHLRTSLTFVTKEDQSYIPIFKKGYIDNSFAPALIDSVWVEDVTVSPGEKFSVTMYNANEQPIYKMNIPLEYWSNNIVFDSISVDGTRAFNAIVANLLPDDSQKKALITIRFDDDMLLPVGEGPIAVLHFTCLPTGTSASVNLDTTEFEFGDYYFQLGQLFGYTKIYPDFHAGTISVDLSTAVGDEVLSNLPITYELAQNCPNPFNPTTAIAFALPERSRVSLEVFNILGQTVRQLVDETLPAGNHTVIFDGLDNDGQELASGVYLYRIKTERFSQSKKMMLMK